MSLFKEVESQPDFPAFEREMLRFWEMEKPFEALRRRNAKGKTWSFVDGPITANNPMGVHHAWGRTYKDIFQRHRAMLGFHQRYQNGFDCQGLWVEVEVEKALGLGSKREILAYGLAEFSERCKERVATYAAVQTEQSKRLGQWMDWDHSYYTYTDRNIEAIWHFLKVCHERGWLYKGFRSMPWCPRCGSSLSKHEQSDSYEELTHQSVFFRLPITDRPGEYFLAWTTTPWTLAANAALAVHPELTYLKVKQGDATYVLAEGAKGALVPTGHFEVLAKLKGSDLVGMRYSGPVDVPPRRGLDLRVIPWTDVGAAEGTGIVHIAPGCGAEDFELGQKHGLPILVPIDEAGYYTADHGEFAGKYALGVAPDVFAHLERTGHMVRVEPWTHRYPVCWRCKNELVFRAVDEWFIKVDELRPRLIEEAAKVRWIPEYAGKRMHDWLANNMGDWCISRKRFWGLPLPIYRAADGSETIVVGSREELDRLSQGASAGLRELHRPWIDGVKIVSPATGKILERVPDVGDCWLDAGIVYHSTLPYFQDRAEWSRWFPAEFITEMVEQVRLWFYATLFMSVTLEGKAPYRTVLTYETVLDAYGRRISKTLKNGIPFDEAVERMGADVMRWMYASAPLSRNIRFGYASDVGAGEDAPPVAPSATAPTSGEDDKRITGEEARRRLLTLWNVYAFFVTYANIAPTKRLAEPIATTNLTDIDRWILARLQRLVSACTVALGDYDTPTMTREVERFVDDLSNWFVRLSRKRFSRADDEKDRQVAFAVLYRCLKTLIKLLAPVLPFTSEKIYQNLVRRVEETAPASVHLNPYPVAEPGHANDTLLTDMEAVQAVCTLAHAARAKSKLKVRQPLKELIVHVGGSPSLERSVQTFSALIQHEVNVKAVKLLADLASVQHTKVKPNFKLLGRKYGAKLNDVARAIEAADHRDLARNLRAGREISLEHAGETFRLAPEELTIETSFAPHLVALTEGEVTVCLNTRITDELRFEGLARDAIRQIQSMRKDFDYAMGARIAVQIAGAGPELAKALDAHQAELERDTLALAFELAPAVSLRDQKVVELGGETLTIAIAPR